ncbi:MAG: class I SAM-dependent methyltransferase [Rubripirellula sp.]
MTPKTIENDDAVTDWWKSFYDDLAMLVLKDQSPKQIEADVTAISHCLQVPSNCSLLDQCCGLGQHAVALARRGHRVVGIDQAANYVEEARRSAHDSGVDVDFEVADALKFVTTDPVDAVLNWHSSFGYLASDRSNAAMLRNGYESLKPGGRLLLEFPNMVHLIKGFRPKMTQKLKGNVELTRTSRLDLPSGTLLQRWSYRAPDGREKHHRSQLRVYLPDQLVRLMSGAGFGEFRVLSHAGNDLVADDARCIIVGRRPLDD